MNGGIRNSISGNGRVRGANDMCNSKITAALAIKALDIAKAVFAVSVMLLAVGNGWSAGLLSVWLIGIVGGAEIAKVLVKINYFENKKESKIDS
jgi:hypothetical protein